MDELLQRFYSAFDRHDGDAMASCYAPDAHFWDPVFGDLDANETGQMWRMLTGRADDLKVELVEHSASAEGGSAKAIARYTFSQTGRPVVNEISSTFRFRDGLIADQRDEFDFTKWARQAVGIAGVLPPVRAKIRQRARASLDAFMTRPDRPSS